MPGVHMSDKLDSELTNNMKPQESESRQSLLAAMNKFVQAVNEMDGTVMIPSRLRDITVKPEETSPANSKAVVPAREQGSQMVAIGDLYSFYTMLNAIKTELVRGPRPEEPEDLESSDEGVHEEDEQARQTATVFRHHLRGLFSVLRQLTDTAQVLTTRYQEELGLVIETPSRIPAFTL